MANSTRITWTETLEGNYRELCPGEESALESLAAIAEGMGYWDPDAGPSFPKFFRKNFRAGLPDEWIRDFLLVPVNRKKSSAVNFVADSVITFDGCECGDIHQIRLEISFDNRQIIGTNFLKMLVGTNSESDRHRRYLGIIVCPSRDAKKEFGLDASVASSDEYLLAIESGYSSLTSSPIVLGVVRPS